MIPFAAAPPPPQPAQSTIVQYAAATPQQALDPKGRGPRRSPLNRRGRRHLEAEMRRKERREFRRERQLEITLLAAIYSPDPLRESPPLNPRARAPRNSRLRRLARAVTKAVNHGL